MGIGRSSRLSKLIKTMKLFQVALIISLFTLTAFAQIPTATLVQIVKAEDARRYDKTLEDLMANPNPAIRTRAALAAGRIGDDKAIPVLTALLEKEQSESVRAVAAFAIGEVESVKGADTILNALKDPKTPDAVRGRAVEAAGKIAAANAKDPKARELGDAILETIGSEDDKGSKIGRDTILLGITAVLRARPANGDVVVARFLTDADARIREDAANTLARLRARNANQTLRAMLQNDKDAVVRSKAAGALGAADDKAALDILIKAAINDEDLRVRVSAIRSLASLKDAKAADAFIELGETLLAGYKRSKFANPTEKTEMLEIATALGRLLQGSNNEKALPFLRGFREADKFHSAETETAFARVAPDKYVSEFSSKNNGYSDWQIASAYAAGLTEIAASRDAAIKIRAAQALTAYVSGMAAGVKQPYQGSMIKALPDLASANRAFKPDNLDKILRDLVANDDLYVRATGAGLLANQPTSKENVEALKKAFDKALVMDKDSDDAQLAILDALYKLDKKESVGTLLVALNAPDYLVRKKAFELLADKHLQKDFPGISTSLENARAKRKDQLLPYSPIFGTKLGQVLNTDYDYRRALLRKNGTVRAVLTTEKGTFTIVFAPEDAPLTVDNFIKLARSGYFNGLTVHRVVANFVMQDGDPRGDGSGGPGWSIRCEVNMLPYDRGAVGMALSGKDTGGSQWFVTHSPQPHLDGGYTVFGHVNETDMKVVDNIVRGDKIISVKIVEGNSSQRRRGH